MGIVLPIIPIAILPESDEIDTDPFQFQIRLLPKSESFVFDPMKLSLIIDEQVYTPIGYKKLTASYQYGRIGECDLFCNYNEGPFVETNESVPITNNLCFEIKFPYNNSVASKKPL